MPFQLRAPTAYAFSKVALTLLNSRTDEGIKPNLHMPIAYKRLSQNGLMYFHTSGIAVSPVIPFGAAFVVSFLTSMVGISGAFLLVPFQMSVLGITSLSVSATNLVFNLVSTPGGIWRFARDGRLDVRLGLLIAAGTLPGLFIGWWVRTHWLFDPHSFRLFVGGVLSLLAVRMLLPQRAGRRHVVSPRFTEKTVSTVAALALVVGVIGGTYGIGGGALMAPVLVGFLGLRIPAVAGATLLATFITSIAGVSIYSLLPGPDGAQSSPDWPLGLILGLGGLVGTYIGAFAQKYLPEGMLRVGLALLIAVLSLTYFLQSLLAR